MSLHGKKPSEWEKATVRTSPDTVRVPRMLIKRVQDASRHGLGQSGLSSSRSYRSSLRGPWRPFTLMARRCVSAPSCRNSGLVVVVRRTFSSNVSRRSKDSEDDRDSAPVSGRPTGKGPQWLEPGPWAWQRGSVAAAAAAEEE